MSSLVCGANTLTRALWFLNDASCISSFSDTHFCVMTVFLSLFNDFHRYKSSWLYILTSFLGLLMCFSGSPVSQDPQVGLEGWAVVRKAHLTSAHVHRSHLSQSSVAALQAWARSYIQAGSFPRGGQSSSTGITPLSKSEPLVGTRVLATSPDQKQWGWPFLPGHLACVFNLLLPNTLREDRALVRWVEDMLFTGLV